MLVTYMLQLWMNLQSVTPLFTAPQSNLVVLDHSGTVAQHIPAQLGYHNTGMKLFLHFRSIGKGYP